MKHSLWLLNPPFSFLENQTLESMYLYRLTNPISTQKPYFKMCKHKNNITKVKIQDSSSHFSKATVQLLKYWNVTIFVLSLCQVSKSTCRRARYFWLVKWKNLTSLFGCKLKSASSIHLRLSLGTFHWTCMVCNLVEEKLKRILAPWKKQYLSMGGRATLWRVPLKPSHIFHILYYDAKESDKNVGKISKRFLAEEPF